MIKRPETVTDEYLEYLDNLRDSGETNMYGARAYLLRAYPELTNSEAGLVLTYWMESFGERH